MIDQTKKHYTLRYDGGSDSWSTTIQTHQRKEVRFATKEDIKNFYMWRYEEIFPGFNVKEGHECLLGNAAIPDAQTMIWQVPVEEDQLSQQDEIPPGVYQFIKTSSGYVLKALGQIEQDDYVDLNNPVQSIYADADWFFSNLDSYRRLKIRPRRACLAWGPPGNGKTREVIRVFHELCRKYSAYALILPTAENDMSYLEPYKKAFRDKLTLFSIEEITEKFDHRGSTDMFLTFLDGESSWSDSYLVATTNYPGKLPPNVVDRPGRFDLKIEVNSPDENARRRYLEHFFGKDFDGLSDVIGATKNLSIAYLKELVVQTKLRGRTFHEVLTQFHRDRKLCETAFSQKQKAGFFSDE